MAHFLTGIDTISVPGPFGISQALIERAGEKWPDKVILRLHLKGLENFNVTNGKVTLEAAVSSQDGKVRLWKNGKEDSPLNAESPYWMQIRLIGKDGKPVKAIPLNDGYFEIRLPKALLNKLMDPALIDILLEKLSPHITIPE